MQIRWLKTPFRWRPPEQCGGKKKTTLLVICSFQLFSFFFAVCATQAVGNVIIFSMYLSDMSKSWWFGGTTPKPEIRSMARAARMKVALHKQIRLSSQQGVMNQSRMLILVYILRGPKKFADSSSDRKTAFFGLLLRVVLRHLAFNNIVSSAGLIYLDEDFCAHSCLTSSN